MKHQLQEGDRVRLITWSHVPAWNPAIESRAAYARTGDEGEVTGVDPVLPGETWRCTIRWDNGNVSTRVPRNWLLKLEGEEMKEDNKQEPKVEETDGGPLISPVGHTGARRKLTDAIMIAAELRAGAIQNATAQREIQVREAQERYNQKIDEAWREYIKAGLP